jgi:hypothetical protein
VLPFSLPSTVFTAKETGFATLEALGITATRKGRTCAQARAVGSRTDGMPAVKGLRQPCNLRRTPNAQTTWAIHVHLKRLVAVGCALQLANGDHREEMCSKAVVATGLIEQTFYWRLKRIPTFRRVGHLGLRVSLRRPARARVARPIQMLP